jgi:hypothetical protein
MMRVGLEMSYGRAMKLRAALALCAVTAIAPTAHGQERVRLRVEASEAASCVAGALLSARVGYEAIDDAAAREVAITADALGDGLAATVRLPDASEERVISTPDRDCLALRERVLVALAIWLTPVRSPDAPLPAPPRDPSLVRISATASPEDLLLWRVLGDEQWQRICAMPCDFDIVRGRHTLALSRTEANRPQSAPVIDLDRDGAIHADIEDRGTLRAIGWTVLPVGVLVLGPLGAWGMSEAVRAAVGPSDDTDLEALGAGLLTFIVLAAASVTVGIILGVSRDRVTVRVGEDEQ